MDHSKRRITHVPKLTDELSTAEDRRLNPFGFTGRNYREKPVLTAIIK